jgi:glycerol-3-phosphate dehydrogenase
MFRQQAIEKARTESFDLIIIGGGITGAGIFLRAAQRGLKPLLIEKGDFASGTSSRSSKLVHGGLRYLAYFQIKMVYEGLYEREHLLKLYPHLVKPQSFFMPVYHSWVNRLKFSVGLTGYDMLQGKSLLPKHISIPKDEILIRFPQVVSEDLKGGFIYYDARTNDARLTSEVIQQATELGAVALNYMEVTAFRKEGNQLKSVSCTDTMTGTRHEFTAPLIISATGVWSDETVGFCEKPVEAIMKPSKGIHVVVSGDFFPKDAVLILPSAEGDGRFIWCVPWEDNLNVIGTTDTNYSGDINHVRTEQQEIMYLLNAVNRYLNGQKVSEADVLSFFAGLRPLLNDHEEEDESTSRSRDYNIWWVTENYLAISGGKLTSFLSMADSVLKEIETKQIFTHLIDRPEDKKPEKKSLPSFPVYQMLRELYGDQNTLLIKAIIEENVGHGSRLDIKYRYLVAEIIFFIRYQQALTLDDVFTRRTLISYNMQEWDEALINKTCRIFASELGWTDEHISHHKAHYRKSWDAMHSWV